ncbi:MAG: hypothetical protein E7599_01235 [Ruminococcaceae bacterium]|nr:hypothetical protein [Oscillospiraceae bacterium]
MKKRLLSAILAIMMIVCAVPAISLAATAEELAYTSKGLVSHFDGYQNTEKGHDANATVWEDLAGDNDITVAKTATNYFTENAFHLEKAQYNLSADLLALVNSAAFTVEISIGAHTMTGTNYSTLMNTTNDNFALFHQKNNNSLVFKNSTNGRPQFVGATERVPQSTIAITFEKGVACRLYLNGQCLSETVPSKLIGGTGSLFIGNSASNKCQTVEFESLRFYDRALTEKEVIQNATVDGNYPMVEAEVVTKDLVAHYDAKMNTSKGHDDKATSWEDLAGNNDIDLSSAVTSYFTEDALYISKEHFAMPSAITDVVNGESFTVELEVGSIGKLGTFVTFLHSANDNFSLFVRAEGDYIEFKNAKNDRPKVTGGMAYFTDSTVTVTFEKGKACNMYVDGIFIGTATPSKLVNADTMYLSHSEYGYRHNSEYRGMRFYSRALTEAEIIQNAKADGNYYENVSPVKYGLVSYFNGTMNTSKGHDAAATVWEDLVGDNDITVANTTTNYFKDDAFHLEKAQYTLSSNLLDLVNGSAFTVEMSIGSYKTNGSTFGTLLCNDKNDNFSIFIRKSGDFIEFKNTSNARPKVAGGTAYITGSTLSITFTKGGKCNMYIDGICIATTTASKLIGADGNLVLGHTDSTKTTTVDFESLRFYNRALSAAEVAQNAMADGNYDPDYVPPMDYVNVKQPKTNIVGDIAFIEELKTAKQLTAYESATALPATLILTLNEKLEVLASDNSVIGTLEAVLEKMDGIIPAFRVNSAAIGTALVEYVEPIKLRDAFIITSDPAIMKAVRGEYPLLRGVLDLTQTYANTEPTPAVLTAIRKAVSTAPCRIALLPTHFSDSSVISKLNNWQVATWLTSANSDVASVCLTEMLSGAYGILTDDTAAMYAIASTYIEANALTRPAMNIGHRCFPAGSYPENSIEGAMEAYEMGADAVEVDIYLTTDGKLAINHNSTTDAMFDNNLTVENCTMAQLKELKYKGYEDQPYTMPSLDEFFKKFKGMDMTFVIEIKSTKLQIVTVLKELIEEYDIYDQCYIITFGSGGMHAELQKTLPEVPAGYLYSPTNSSDSVSALATPLETILPFNTTFNPSYSGYTTAFTRHAVLHGVQSNVWTVNHEASAYANMLYGHASVTTDHCDWLGALEKSIVLNLAGNTVKGGNELSYTVSSKTWSRKTADVTANAKITVLEGKDLVTVKDGKLSFANKSGTVTLMASYVETVGDYSYTLYDQPMTITVEEVPFGFAGYQIGTSDSSIRFVGYTDSLEYDTIDLAITVTGDAMRTFSSATRNVYKTLNGTVDGKVQAVATTDANVDALVKIDHDYLYGYAITGITDGSYTFTIVPTAILGGEMIMSATIVLQVTVADGVVTVNQ